MSQTIEIEFKNELTLSEYKIIKTHFQLQDSQFFVQDNHYFDTKDFDLKENKSALRIRKKGQAYELTLKQPIANGLLETNQTITEMEANAAINQNIIPQGEVTNFLLEMNIHISDIHFFGTLSTKRAEWKYKNGLLVLDYSTYLNVEDYELEYEVEDFQTGQSYFLELLSTLQIPKRKTENKVMRFYERKYLQIKSDQSL
ncbi:CYTH domain-containing protein [Bacillus sp. CGMCC 1.16607]|uniref:CYTH domain-containing protein n=1 Tax=Bacillus sp. CGMCC 1.16607 TaxID=3351842 RepID=UPI003640378B